MICSSVNLLRFMSVSFAGEQTNLKVRTFQGSRSLTHYLSCVTTTDLSLLLEEGYRIEQAYVLRSNGNGRGIAPRAWGSLAGGLLLRTFTRAQKVYESMLCRGFTGELRYLRMVRLSAGSLVYLAGWVIFFIGVRFNNIPVKLGDWVRGAFG